MYCYKTLETYRTTAAILIFSNLLMTHTIFFHRFLLVTPPCCPGVSQNEEAFTAAGFMYI